MIPSGKSEVTVTESLSLAFQKSQDCGLAPIWVAEEEVKALTPTKTDVFVLDPFEGPAFDHVTSNVKFKCTIVGKYVLLFPVPPNTCNSAIRSDVFAGMFDAEHSSPGVQLPALHSRHAGLGGHLLWPGQESEGEH